MNTKEKYFNISLLRTMATIIIVVFHILLKTSPGDGRTYFPFYIGVPVFLFVSGFLYARKPITDIKQFYKNINKPKIKRKEQKNEKTLHPPRVVGGYRHHRNSGSHAAAGTFRSAG